MTQPTNRDHYDYDSDPHGFTPRQQDILRIALRATRLAAIVTFIVSSGMIVVFRAITGHWPVDQTPGSALFWRIDPTVFTVGALAVVSTCFVSFIVFPMIAMHHIQPQSLSPRHLTGLINVVGSLIAAIAACWLASLIWSAYASLLVALISWVLLYSGIIPLIIDGRQRRN